METLIEDMQSISANLASMTRTPPIAWPYVNSYDMVGVVGNDGVTRTGSSKVAHNGPGAKVIDIHRGRSI